MYNYIHKCELCGKDFDLYKGEGWGESYITDGMLPKTRYVCMECIKSRKENNMLKDNVKIKTSKGEYKDFPYKKELYIYGTCIWTDDFPTDVPDELCIKSFIEQLEEECL